MPLSLSGVIRAVATPVNTSFFIMLFLSEGTLAAPSFAFFRRKKIKPIQSAILKMIPYSKGTGLAFIKIALRTKRQSCESYFAKPAELPTQEIRLGVRTFHPDCPAPGHYRRELLIAKRTSIIVFYFTIPLFCCQVRRESVHLYFTLWRISQSVSPSNRRALLFSGSR